MALFLRGGSKVRTLYETVNRLGGGVSTRGYRDWQTWSSRPPMYEEQVKKKRNGLKIVVENRNVYEGQYIKVTHVVYDGPDSSQPASVNRSHRALPGWMGPGATTPARRRRPSGLGGPRLLT